jgi:hypothetical protein
MLPLPAPTLPPDAPTSKAAGDALGSGRAAAPKRLDVEVARMGAVLPLAAPLALPGSGLLRGS